jgi:hypothetical protein
MQLETSSKAARRQIADEFKDRKVPRGIFAIRCALTGEAWVGSSPNLDAAKNSLWFQLRGGLSRHQSLQRAWTRHGEDAFSIDILERLDDETPELLLNDLLKTRKAAWALSMSAAAL